MNCKNKSFIENLEKRRKYLMDNDPHDFEWCCQESESEYFILDIIKESIVIKYEKSITLCKDSLSQILIFFKESSKDNFIVDLRLTILKIKKIKHTNKFLKNKKKLTLNILEYIESLFEDEYTYLEIHEFKRIIESILTFVVNNK